MRQITQYYENIINLLKETRKAGNSIVLSEKLQE